MKTKTIKTFLSLLIVPVAFSFWLAPALAAPCPDADSDGYITLGSSAAATVLGSTFQPDGTYPDAQWQSFFDAYKSDLSAAPDPDCDNLNFKTGAEPLRCDAPLTDPASGVFDSSKVPSVSGSAVHPGAYDIPDNGIDENCDGGDGKFVAAAAPGVTKDLGALVQKWVSLLGKAVAVISVIVLIWGGILYATAAGDEQKVAKARKAIIGAIIGLIIGLLAPSIVNYVSGALL